MDTKDIDELMKRPYLYRLDENNNPVPERDVIAWGKWMETNFADRRVGKTQVGPATVYTSFLGLDHNLGLGPPDLYETMVKENEMWWDLQHRYSTRAQAEKGHAKTVKRVLAVIARRVQEASVKS